MYEQNVIKVKEHSGLLSFAYKWLGQGTEVKGLDDYKGYEKNKDSDKELVKELWSLFNEADIVIAHNGDQFDCKVANARFSYYNLPPPSPYRTIDTLKISRRYFKFESNKLDSLGEYLGLGRKVKHEGIDMWLGCMMGLEDSWQKMKLYNRQDVILLEKVYLRLLPWMKQHPNLGVYSDKAVCPKCGSEEIQFRGKERTQTAIYRKFQCKSCGSWGRSVFKEAKNKPSLVSI